MTYGDPRLKKDPDGIKCRLDEFDLDRLDILAERTGRPRAVLIRDAVIEHLDRAGIDYNHAPKRMEFQQRRIALAVSDRIRAMAEEIGRSGAHEKKPLAAGDINQQTLFRRG